MVLLTGSPYLPTPTGKALANPYTEPSIPQVQTYRWHAEVVCELDVLSDAWNLARRRALGRLREEALQVGADAVLGVRLRRGDHDLGKNTIEYVVTGTAVRFPNSSGTESPTLTDVSIQDYWRMHGAGHQPAGLLAGTSVVFASPPISTRLRRLRTTSRNQELSELSLGFRTARESVRRRLVRPACRIPRSGRGGRRVLPILYAVRSSLWRRRWHRGTAGGGSGAGSASLTA